ncbi:MULTISPECIES: FHA domain-containing protein [Methylomonas]|uniref:FHA domain-containing protein n=1 Tax=Methylomonas TaxID=416 RepID=UPI001232ECF5|nr:FHA domain-containing protein [Methylomonas rhizoryzae]
MKLMRCEYGHYYDASQHSRCPTCGVADLGVQTQVSQSASARIDHEVTQVRGQANSVADIGVTVAMVRKNIGIDPVVGWLVCVEGPEKGRDYRIRSERNSIGRGAGMAICIQGDEAISRENHAYVSFNPRAGTFRIAPGDGRGMTYLNGNEVDVPMPLNAYDRIELGQTALLFIPLCGERFGWENRED